MIKTAFIFPGQGSQIVGMGKDFFERFEKVKEIYKEAEEILGFNISDISFNGPEGKLKQTKYTQPALYVNSLAISSVLQEHGVKADMAAGHSLGEFSALANAKAFSFADGLKLVKKRASLMQKAGDDNPGTMAALIGLSAEEAANVCRKAGKDEVVQVANYNSPKQIVISGSEKGVFLAMELAKESGARRVIKLPVSGAFHSPLMESAVKEFGSKLEEICFEMVDIPVYPNVTAEPVENIDEIKRFLYDQLTHSVRWVETIENMIENGTERFVEVGAGKVLSGLVSRINRDVKTVTCGTVEEFDKFLQEQ